MGTRLISLENVQRVSFNGLWRISKRARAQDNISGSTFVFALAEAVDLLYPHSDQKVLHQAVSSKDGTLLGRLNLSCTQS